VKQKVPVEARTQGGIIKYKDCLKFVSQRNRKVPTESEQLFWKKVLSRDETGFRFLRQKPIGRFIVDFYCSKLLIVIEIDGSSHDRQYNHDPERDKYFEVRGIITIRYSNEMVNNDMQYIIDDLKLRLKNRALELKIA